jgi:S-adenosylmethionine decarboxylase
MGSSLESPIPICTGSFCKEGDVEFAGVHLLIDLWNASRLDEIDYMKEVLQSCVTVSSATLLHLHCHQFSESGGLSAIAVLAESHISVHTWPERDFAAFDVFMCGATQPAKVVDVLKEAFKPERLSVKRFLRGQQKL